MAVSIDTVYQKVLALANKEQRGYITPQEFNLFADMAQKEIFEQYFYDINQWNRRHGNDHDYSDMLTNLEEKIGVFEHFANHDNVTVTNKYGDVSLASDLPNLYRLGGIRVKYPENDTYVEAEVVSSKEFILYSQTSLTKPTRKRPVYVRFTTAGLSNISSDRIKIYPYPVQDDGGDFDLSTDEYTTTPVTVTSVLHPSSTASSQTGRYFHFALDEMQQLLGQAYDSGTVFQLDHFRNGTLLAAGINMKLFDDSSGNSLGPNDGHGRYNPWTSSTDLDFEVGDMLNVAGSTMRTNKRNVRVDYTNKPSTPKWAYVVLNEKALYNANESENFQLHQSEESELVYRILAYAGIAINKPTLTQVAAGLEQAKVQQEKQ